MESGLPREEAQRRAKLAFGGMEQAKEECREALGVQFIETLLQGLRFGLRMLGKPPGSLLLQLSRWRWRLVRTQPCSASSMLSFCGSSHSSTRNALFGLPRLDLSTRKTSGKSARMPASLASQGVS